MSTSWSKPIFLLAQVTNVYVTCLENVSQLKQKLMITISGINILINNLLLSKRQVTFSSFEVVIWLFHCTVVEFLKNSIRINAEETFLTIQTSSYFNNLVNPTMLLLLNPSIPYYFWSFIQFKSTTFQLTSITINPLHACLFLYSLKISGNLWFSENLAGFLWFYGL